MRSCRKLASRQLPVSIPSSSASGSSPHRLQLHLPPAEDALLQEGEGEACRRRLPELLVGPNKASTPRVLVFPSGAFSAFCRQAILPQHCHRLSFCLANELTTSLSGSFQTTIFLPSLSRYCCSSESFHISSRPLSLSLQWQAVAFDRLADGIRSHFPTEKLRL